MSIETRARQIAAGKMGLINDPHGERLPADMWKQCERDALIEELLIAKHEALGKLLGAVDIVMLAEEYPDVFCISQKLAALRAARKEYDLAAAAYLDARMIAK